MEPVGPLTVSSWVGAKTSSTSFLTLPSQVYLALADLPFSSTLLPQACRPSIAKLGARHSRDSHMLYRATIKGAFGS